MHMLTYPYRYPTTTKNQTVNNTHRSVWEFSVYFQFAYPCACITITTTQQRRFTHGHHTTRPLTLTHLYRVWRISFSATEKRPLALASSETHHYYAHLTIHRTTHLIFIYRETHSRFFCKLCWSREGIVSHCSTYWHDSIVGYTIYVSLHHSPQSKQFHSPYIYTFLARRLTLKLSSSYIHTRIHTSIADLVTGPFVYLASWIYIYSFITLESCARRAMRVAGGTERERIYIYVRALTRILLMCVTSFVVA